MTEYRLVISDALRQENGETLTIGELREEVIELLASGYLTVKSVAEVLVVTDEADWLPAKLKSGEMLDFVKDAPHFVRVTNPNGDQFLRRKDISRSNVNQDCQFNSCRAYFAEEPKTTKGVVTGKHFWNCPVCRRTNYIE